MFLKLTYVSGLRQNIRELVETQMTADSTLRQIKEMAATIEVAHSRKKTNVVAAVMTQPPPPLGVWDLGQAQTLTVPTLQQIIRQELSGSIPGVANSAAVANANSSRPNSSRGADSARRPQVTEAMKRLGPMADRGWVYCNRCCQWGMHIRPECTWSFDQIKAAPKIDVKHRPGGTPSDKKYPNV